MEHERAVVLRIKEHRVTLLARNRGVVKTAIYTYPLLLGSVIRCVLCKGSGGMRAEQIELLAVPFAIAREDLLFFHHVLEMCDAFIPEGVRAPEVFDPVLVLYDSHAGYLNDLCKKLFLCRLLIGMGLYDGLPKIGADLLATILAMPVDIARWRTIDLDSQHELDTWLLACVASHPMIEQFNTVHFLTGRR